MLLVFLYFLSGVATLALTLAAFAFDRRLLFAAGLAAWVWSFLGSWSIGAYTLVFAFVLTMSAVGHATRLVRRSWEYLPAAVVGVGLWVLMLLLVDRRWWFFPLPELLGALGEF